MSFVIYNFMQLACNEDKKFIVTFSKKVDVETVDVR